MSKIVVSAAAVLFIFASQLGYCDETVNETTIGIAQQTVGSLTSYFGFLQRCPIEPIQLVSSFKRPHYVHEGDACTVGSVAQPQRSAKSFLVCEKSNGTIYVRLGDIYYVWKAVKNLMAEQTGQGKAEKMGSISDFFKLGARELTKAVLSEIPVPVPTWIPGYNRCGKYVSRRCPGDESFNFLKQQCLNGTLVVSGVRLFVSLAQEDFFKPKVLGKDIPPCVLRLLPDMIQYLLTTIGEKRTNWRTVIGHVRQMGNNTAHAAHLLAITARDFVNISRMSLSESEKAKALYLGGSSVLGLFDILTGNKEPHTVSRRYFMDLLHGVQSLTTLTCSRESVNPEEAFNLLATNLAKGLETPRQPPFTVSPFIKSTEV